MCSNEGRVCPSEVREASGSSLPLPSSLPTLPLILSSFRTDQSPNGPMQSGLLTVLAHIALCFSTFQNVIWIVVCMTVFSIVP